MSVEQLIVEAVKSGGTIAVLGAVLILLLRGDLISRRQHQELMDAADRRYADLAAQAAKWEAMAMQGIRLAEVIHDAQNNARTGREGQP